MVEPEFPALVRALRHRLGLTQEQLAQEVGVSFSTVNVWENGKRAPLPFLRKRLIEMAKQVGLLAESKIAPRRRRKEQ
jgi:putative transcriptional regulator